MHLARPAPGAVARWPVDTIDWKERYKTLANCGRANPLQEMINLDDYDFFITARVAKPPEGQDEGDLLFIHRATWYEKFADVYRYPPGDHHPVNGAALTMTLDEPLNLPEGLLSIYTEDGESEIEDMEPTAMVHAHYKPTGRLHGQPAHSDKTMTLTIGSPRDLALRWHVAPPLMVMARIWILRDEPHGQFAIIHSSYTIR